VVTGKNKPDYKLAFLTLNAQKNGQNADFSLCLVVGHASEPEMIARMRNLVDIRFFFF